MRRLLLPLTLTVELVLLAMMVPTAVVGLLGLVVDRRGRLLRLAAMGASYLVVELAGLAVLFAVWLLRPVRGRDWWDRANVAVVAWALGRILGAARRTVGFSVSVQDPPADSPSPFGGRDPVLVLARHGGIGDSFTLVWLLTARYGRRPRIVLKRVLLLEPLIDVALTRMDACFLPPAARRGEALDGRVAALAGGLRPGDALLLFPEGANWTPRRRLRAMARLWAAGKPDAVKASALMEHVLPPRAGGVLACLDARSDLPVVVVAHTGLDKLTTVGQVWAALPFTVPMAVRWWPAAPPPPAPPLPGEEDDRVRWLTAEWAVVDQWIDAHRAGHPV